MEDGELEDGELEDGELEEGELEAPSTRAVQPPPPVPLEKGFTCGNCRQHGHRTANCPKPPITWPGKAARKRRVVKKAPERSADPPNVADANLALLGDAEVLSPCYTPLLSFPRSPTPAHVW